MAFELQFFGATERVTGSLYVLRAGPHTLLLECGLVQGTREEELRNREAFPVDVAQIDAVVLSHSHIDHSGRIPRLVKEGFEGPIYTHEASRALCAIMLPDSGYLNEKEAEWESRKRQKKNLPGIEPLYTQADAEACIGQFVGLEYEIAEANPAGPDADTARCRPYSRRVNGRTDVRRVRPNPHARIQR